MVHYRFTPGANPADRLTGWGTRCDNEPLMAEDTDKRCPTCGEGALVDVSFDLDASADADGSQEADSRQIETYSCGHTVVGPRLSSADQDALTVERRTSDETVAPIEDDAPPHDTAVPDPAEETG